MNGGNIEQIGSPAEVYREPASVFVASFLGAPAMNLLPATVTAPGEVALDAAAHHRITGAGIDRGVGDKVIVGIRPEGVTLATPSTPALAVRLDLIEELGGSRIAYCALAGAEIAMILPQDLQVSDGTTLEIGLPRAALHYFDARTGKRLSSLEEESTVLAHSIAAE
jgi:sn-glycerol 3-phosphate transport system ATP-binding protein